MKADKAVIIGLGLIGGSLAKALRERVGVRNILALTPERASLDKAMEEGVITGGFTEFSDELLDADIIYLCTPVKHTPHYLSLLSGRVSPGCVVTDVGSTKGDIIKFISSMPAPPCFIGGHPMAGSEKSGYSASRAHLFENAYYILTPSPTATTEALELLEHITRSIGALPVVLDSGEHDRITGGISHLPHILAALLVNLVRDMETPDGKMRLLAAGGFKDITRIASSSPEMWESIVTSNSGRLSAILEDYKELLENFKRVMESGDSKALYDIFESARTFRDSFAAGGRKGLIAPVYDIIADVVDKPGIIGEIATLLGNHGVNIKNINVSNSREFEQGCLRITLPDAAGMEAAYRLLSQCNYRVYKV